MNSDVFGQVFDDVTTTIERNLQILWPASGSTAPTESNIVTALSSALGSRGYAVFTEVPFETSHGNGRIDLVAIHKEQRDLVLFEAKSDKPSDDKLVDEMTNDWARLDSFTLDKLPANQAWINSDEGNELKKHICVGFWSESETKTKGDNLLLKGVQPKPESYEKWIANDVNIGVKFFFKSC